MTVQHFWMEEPKRRIPAWGMSAALHVVVIVSVALLWRNAQPSARGITESNRTGAIVVAVSANGQTEYFDESDSTSTDSNSVSSDATASSSADALPAVNSNALPELPDIALPGAVQGPAAGELLQQGDLGAKGGGGLPPGADIDSQIKRIREQEAANRGPPPIGTPAPLNVFGSPSVGRSFVFVIDRSKSMGGSGLGALLTAQKELKAGLASLSSSQRFEIIVYHQSPDSFGRKYNGRTGLVKITEERIKEVNAFFEGLIAFGSTQHSYALEKALDLRPEVIYFLTDGRDPVNPAQIKRMIARAKGQGTTIHSIQFGFGPLQEKDNFMMVLSRGTGGGFKYQQMSGR